MPPNNRESCPSIASMTEAFLSSSLGAPLFILDPSHDLDVVFTNPPTSRYFDLPDEPSDSWFVDKWPKGHDVDWRSTFIERVRKTHKFYQLIPESLVKPKASAQELCFMWFEVESKPFIAAVILNANTRTLGNFDPIATQIALAEGNFYHSILDSMHDSVGLFEFDAQGVMRLVWLNERAMRYASHHEYVAGEPAVNFLFEGMKESWLGLEHTLLNSEDSVSCCFMLSPELEENVCEMHFHPVKLVDAAQGKQFIANWYNVTKRYQNEIAEAQRQQDFYNLVENAPDLIVRYDVTGKRTYVNKAFESITGIPREKAVGKLTTELSGIGKSAIIVQDSVMEVLRTGQTMIKKLNVAIDQGHSVIHELRLIPEFDNHGAILGVLLIARDLTSEEQAIQRTEVSEKQFRTLVENSPNYILRFDPKCRLVYANPVITRLFDCNMEDLIGMNPTQMNIYLHQKFSSLIPLKEFILHRLLKAAIANQTEQDCEFSSPSQKGLIHTFLRLTPEFDANGELVSVLAVGHDKTELKAYQEQVDYLSKFDPLTGLPNRMNLLSKVSSRLTGPNANQAKLGLMVLGIDHFKNVNDSFGYEFGDKVLQRLTHKLNDIVASTAYIARIGGDEFGVFLNHVMSRASFANEVERIRKALNTSLVIDDSEVVITVSIGACMYPDDANDLEDLVRYADSALFAAKSEQRGTVRFYSQDLTEKALQRMELRNSIRQAIKHKEFHVYLQPKVRMGDGALVGAEALVRWHHPVRGLVAPDAFIPVAEELGLIGEIDMQVLETLCEHVAYWLPSLRAGQRFAVNLSGLQFNRDDLLAKIKQILHTTECQTEYLELEITEGALLVHCENLSNKINTLKELGFSLALDDFGTGYSSLGYLSRYSIDVLKIDRSFVKDMTHLKSSQVLVKTIVSMAQNLDMAVVAEGVEDLDQVRLLQSFGVEIAQGYLYAKPLPLEVFAKTYGLPMSH